MGRRAGESRAAPELALGGRVDRDPSPARWAVAQDLRQTLRPHSERSEPSPCALADHHKTIIGRGVSRTAFARVAERGHRRASEYRWRT